MTLQARDPAPPGLVKLTCNEVQHLFAALLQAAPWSGAQAATRRAGGEHLTDGPLA